MVDHLGGRCLRRESLGDIFGRIRLGNVGLVSSLLQQSHNHFLATFFLTRTGVVGNYFYGVANLIATRHNAQCRESVVELVALVDEVLQICA